jgi:hypothetical protein
MTEHETERLCPNCVFYADGVCRRNPPQLINRATGNQPPIRYATETTWPWVYATDWCGEFKKEG